MPFYRGRNESHGLEPGLDVVRVPFWEDGRLHRHRLAAQKPMKPAAPAVPVDVDLVPTRCASVLILEKLDGRVDALVLVLLVLRLPLVPRKLLPELITRDWVAALGRLAEKLQA